MKDYNLFMLGFTAVALTVVILAIIAAGVYAAIF